MVLVVTVVSTTVHVYSVGYMSHDHSIPRFMAYLSIFTFAMLMLVTADRSEEHTSELQSLMRISYAVFCLTKKKNNILIHNKSYKDNTEYSIHPYSRYKQTISQDTPI